MIARLDNLRKHPVVFQHLTGLVVVVFDALVAQVVTAVEASTGSRSRAQIGCSAGVGSWWNTRSGGRAGSAPWHM